MRALFALLPAIFTLFTYLSVPAMASDTIDIDELEKRLKTTGLEGWVHGSDPNLKQYVFTYRDPSNFFLNIQLPIVARTDELSDELSKLHRHDKVRLFGKYATHSAPQKHIVVSKIVVLEKFTSPIEAPPHKKQAQLPDDLLGNSVLLGKIHAVVEGGKILVIEYKDAIVPVYSKKPELAKDLYRNDIVRIQYEVREWPNRPTHISLDTSVKTPIEVLDSMVAHHEKQGTLEGVLVMFPKSPQIIFNVFALQIADENGIKRNYTLVNFEDLEVFTAIRDKLQKKWDENPDTIINGRNKYINTAIKLKASGTFNVVAPNQANPQILLNSPDDIEFL